MPHAHSRYTYVAAIDCQLKMKGDMTQTSAYLRQSVQATRPRHGSFGAVWHPAALAARHRAGSGSGSWIAPVYMGDRILAGTRALGRDLGGMTPTRPPPCCKPTGKPTNRAGRRGAELDPRARAGRRPAGRRGDGGAGLSPGESRTVAGDLAAVGHAGDPAAAGSAPAGHSRPACQYGSTNLSATGLALRPGDGGRDSAHAGRPT